MGEGLPLPWPFPWSVPAPAASFETSARRRRPQATPAGDASNFLDVVISEAQKACAQYGDALPAVRESRLYLVEGIAEVPGPAPSGAGKSALAVVYPPEFVFVLDVGLEAFVGGSILWQPVGLGDPGFPEKSAFVLRSVPGLAASQIIFPNVVGSLVIGLKDGADEKDVRRALGDAGLRNIEVDDFFATANCKPFQEASICKMLSETLPFVKYAELNSIQRIVDFTPGWFARRLL